MAVYIHKVLLVGRGNTDTDGVKNFDTLPYQEDEIHPTMLMLFCSLAYTPH